MRINQFSKLTNLSTKTIRYYEDIGILPPAIRLDNGYRDYDERDVDRARFVAGARSLDFSLDDIQEILDDSDGGVYIEGVYPDGLIAYYAIRL